MIEKANRHRAMITDFPPLSEITTTFDLSVEAPNSLNLIFDVAQ